MYLLVLYFPLVSALVVGLFGRFLGKKGASYTSTFLIGCAFLVSSYAFFEVCLCGLKSNICLSVWFNSGLLENSWGFLFDTVTCVMLVVVTSISFLVHLYSVGYMSEDPHIIRFMSYLSLFTFFMLSLVTADNFIQMFLGWEGVGLASYLLINFWFTRVEANRAALKAVIVNRFGDFGIGTALLGIYYVFNNVHFNVVFSLVYSLGSYSVNLGLAEVNGVMLLSFLLFLGVVGKSAQLGLHTWLPDAMEGPTPVSALIHAATMVTAGVFVLIRCSPLFEYSSEVLILVTIMGALTAFFAGTVGIFQNDLKRVIAYSTCSQLGYMVFSCGLSNYAVGMFHLMNHACFKALLFLSAGSVIHALSDEQDMRRMGGLVQLLPLTFVMFLIGSLALMGFPFTTGFYSKDVILELAYSSYRFEGIFSFWLGILGAFCTAFYSFRLIYLTFLAETNAPKKILEGVHDAPLIMAVPLFILGAGSIFVGYIFSDMFIGVGTSFWNGSICTLSSDLLILKAEFLASHIKIFPVVVSIAGAVVALILYHSYPDLMYIPRYPVFFRSIYIFFNKKWLFDIIYNGFFVNGILWFGYEVTFKLLDRGAFELVGPTGLIRFINKYSLKVSKLQSGFLDQYIFVFTLWTVVFVFVLSTLSGIFSALWVFLLVVGLLYFFI